MVKIDKMALANYLTRLRARTPELTYEILAQKCDMSESTIKNLFSGKTEDPRISTAAPVMYVLGGSWDEFFTGESKDEIQEISLNSIKEMYEFQLEEQRKTEEIRITNIRTDHEKHISDLKESHEKQAELKDQLYNEKSREANFFKILACVGFGILIALLILEVANPNLGWLRF
jgi:transcriptional regulator with XRE-family HTH domain